MSRFDVIIVGAGPAGAYAAHELASRNLKVLLIEKEKLPRRKPCGGAIPMTFLQTLSFDCSPVIERVVKRVQFSFSLRDLTEIEIPDLSVAMVRRDLFDYFLVEQAAKAGAKVIDEHAVTGVEILEDKVLVESSGYSWESNYLIGADGVNSRIASLLKLRAGKKLEPALLAEVPAFSEPGRPLDGSTSLTTRDKPEGKDTAHFGFGMVRKGYAWAFPKKESWSMGIKSAGIRGNILKGTFIKWCQFFGYRKGDILLQAYPLPVFQDSEKLNENRVILAGDAAGLVDPLSREGIRPAMTSGRIAAEVIAKAKGPEDLARYTHRVHREICQEFKYAQRLAKIFYTFPRLSYNLGVKNPRVVELFTRLLGGEISYNDILKRAARAVQGKFTLTHV